MKVMNRSFFMKRAIEDINTWVGRRVVEDIKKETGKSGKTLRRHIESLCKKVIIDENEEFFKWVEKL